ncbi:MAG: alanyl-tRNA editing protein [Clostridia bacterium]|nr:alanyl-tRNA editing protein [Clostridia bacterium]
MTEKLFYSDPYLSRFEANVLSCDEINGGFAAVLDKTAFFPTGGGQDCDRGTIDGVFVSDVYEKDGVIFHITEKPLKAGKTVFGEIDFERRFLFMQNHSGEHILSGTVHRMLGYSNVGFHMGSDFVTVDFDGPMTKEQILEAEEKTNEIIWSDLDILTYFPSEKELEKIDYRSKKELSGDIRIVEIPGVDFCACCGTHVKKTGEIGLVKIVEHMNYKGGVRLFILSGKRALEDYRNKNEEIYKIGTLLSRKPSYTAEGVEKLLEENSQKKYEYSLLWKKYVSALTANIENTDGTAVFCENGADNDSLRILALEAAKKCAAAIALSDDKNGVTRYVIASEKTDVREINKKLCDLFSGRGGGKEALCQGSLHTTEEKLREFIKTQM